MYHVRRSETKGELLIKLAQNDNEIADCFHVMTQLIALLGEYTSTFPLRKLPTIRVGDHRLSYLEGTISMAVPFSLMGSSVAFRRPVASNSRAKGDAWRILSAL